MKEKRKLLEIHRPALPPIQAIKGASCGQQWSKKGHLLHLMASQSP